MLCVHCGSIIANEVDKVLINADGDFVCSKQCADEYKREQEYFFNIIIDDDILYNRWIRP